MRKRVIDFHGEALDSELHKIFAPRGRGFHIYHALWMIAEDSGVLDPDYEAIAKQTGLFNFTPKEIEKDTNRLIEKKKIIEFTAKNSKNIGGSSIYSSTNV